MADHVNFYENLDEVRIRLKDSVVMYDGHPYYVLNAANHMKDDVFRLYLDPLKPDGDCYSQYQGGVPFSWSNAPGINECAASLDKWMEANPKAGILRKKMNSPLFNKFRPFPLGMCNVDGDVQYVTRSPTRSTLQGLQSSGCRVFGPSVSPSGASSKEFRVGVTSREMCQTILGLYPSAEESLEHLQRKDCDNTGLAFHREFALMKGPLDMLFLAYKSDVVGVLVEDNFSRVRLGSKFRFLKEVVEDLNVFGDVI